MMLKAFSLNAAVASTLFAVKDLIDDLKKGNVPDTEIVASVLTSVEKALANIPDGARAFARNLDFLDDLLEK